MSSRVFFESVVTSRDFDGRLLAAVYQALNDRRAVIGRYGPVLRAAECDRDFDYVTAAMHNPSRIKRLEARQARILGQCEESTSVTNTELYVRDRLPAASLRRIGTLCATNELHAQSIASADGDARDRTTIAGLARYDLLLPAFRGYYDESVRAIRAKYGDFVLVAPTGSRRSDASISNIMRGFARRGSLDGGHQKSVEAYYRSLAVLETKFLADMIRVVRRTPEIKYVLRLKPQADARDLPREIRENAPTNLHIVTGGPIHPWIIASARVIGHNSTSLVEAAVADRNPVNYVPAMDGALFAPSASAVSTVVSTPHDLQAELVDGGSHAIPVSTDVLARHVPNVDVPYFRRLNNLVIGGSRDETGFTTREHDEKQHRDYPPLSSWSDRWVTRKNWIGYELFSFGGEGGDIRLRETRRKVRRLGSLLLGSSSENAGLRVRWAAPEVIEVDVR